MSYAGTYSKSVTASKPSSLNSRPTAIESKPEFGRIKFEGKDLPPQPATYEKLAVGTSNELLLVSLVAEANFVKAIRAILGGGARAHIEASGGKITKPGCHYSVPADPGKLTKSEEGYTCYTHKLEHGLVHALFVSDKAGFLLSVSDESLWQQLKSLRYTTPILREWVPHVREELVRLGHLRMADSFNCECGVIEATDDQLDKVVSDGLKARALIIPN